MTSQDFRLFHPDIKQQPKNLSLWDQIDIRVIDNVQLCKYLAGSAGNHWFFEGFYQEQQSKQTPAPPRLPEHGDGSVTSRYTTAALITAFSHCCCSPESLQNRRASTCAVMYPWEFSAAASNITELLPDLQGGRLLQLVC